MTPDDLPPEVLDAINTRYPDVFEVKRRARSGVVFVTVEGKRRQVTGDQYQLGGTLLQAQCVDIDLDEGSNSNPAHIGLLVNGTAASKRGRADQFLWLVTPTGQSPRVVSEADGTAMLDAARNRAIADALAAIAIDCSN
ncbi:hypothetical protein [Caballeronia grimmiae]|uniref:hypothetical protein n=1 Tax=Caballeronia grimmiae TaxID=1071679 RepID=UPI0038BE09F8